LHRRLHLAIGAKVERRVPEDMTQIAKIRRHRHFVEENEARRIEQRLLGPQFGACRNNIRRSRSAVCRIVRT
jgi:hypothetical protein